MGMRPAEAASDVQLLPRAKADATAPALEVEDAATPAFGTGSECKVNEMKALWENKQPSSPQNATSERAKEAAELCKSALLHFASDEEVAPMGFSPTGTSESADSPVAVGPAPTFSPQ